MWIYFLPRVLDFNPRPRKEGDKGGTTKLSWGQYFNPRPRKEGDGLGSKFSRYVRYFNPRPRKEGDSKFIQ